MNADYMFENGFAIFDGRKFQALTISKWCKDRGLVYGKDYKYHTRYDVVDNEKKIELIFQFKDPIQATFAMLQWS